MHPGQVITGHWRVPAHAGPRTGGQHQLPVIHGGAIGQHHLLLAGLHADCGGSQPEGDLLRCVPLRVMHGEVFWLVIALQEALGQGRTLIGQVRFLANQGDRAGMSPLA